MFKARVTYRSLRSKKGSSVLQRFTLVLKQHLSRDLKDLYVSALRLAISGHISGGHTQHINLKLHSDISKVQVHIFGEINMQ